MNDNEFWNEVYKELEHINDNLDEWGDGCPDPPVPQELQDTAKRYLDTLRASGQKFIGMRAGRDASGCACVEYQITEDEIVYVDISCAGKAYVYRTKIEVPHVPTRPHTQFEVIEIDEAKEMILKSFDVPPDIINDATNHPTNYSAMKIADKKGVM